MRNRLVIAGAALLAVVVAAAFWLPERGKEEESSSPIVDGEETHAAPDPGGSRAATGPRNGADPSDTDLRRAIDEALTRRRSELPRAANELLPFVETEAGIARLLEMLQASSDPDRKAMIVLALAQSPLEVAHGVVLDAARGEFGEGLRPTAVLVLGQDHREEVTSYLASLAAAPDRPELARSAVQALVFQNTPAAHRALVDFLRDVNDPGLREAMWRAMAGDPSESLPEESRVPTEIRRQVRGVFLPSPEEVESGAVLEPLVAQARAERSPSGRMVAARALLAIPGKRAEEGFRELWGDLDVPMREMLAARLTTGFAPMKLPIVLEKASEENERVRRILVDQVREIAGPAALPMLESWREKETDPGIREGLDSAIRAVRERQ